MGWVCPSCGSENSFETEACRACGHMVRPVHLARARLAAVRDRLRANRFDFLGRSLEERAWERAGQVGGVWRGRLPYVLIVEAVFTVAVLLFTDTPGLFSRLPSWRSAVAAAPQVLLDRGEPAWESLLYDWQPEEERVQTVADGLYAFTESAAARTEELARRAGEDWSTARETAASLNPRLWAGPSLVNIADRIKESGPSALGGRQGVERRAETWEQAKERIAQYQEIFPRRIWEITEKVKSRLQSLKNG